MKARLGVALAAAIVLAGCQTPANVKQLQDENLHLQTQLEAANDKIGDLENRQRMLTADIAELNRVISVLDSEKTSRVRESSSLRGSVRGFVQDQIDHLKAFLVEGNLLDYVGGELVERQETDDKPLMLVDLANPMPKDGVLTGLAAHFTKPVTFTAKVLRPVENDLVVIWESKPFDVGHPGVNRVNFPVSVGVERGDVMGYFFSTPAGVSFDTGTGDTRYQSSDISLGGVIRTASLQGQKSRRAYSLGVYGLLSR